MKLAEIINDVVLSDIIPIPQIALASGNIRALTRRGREPVYAGIMRPISKEGIISEASICLFIPPIGAKDDQIKIYCDASLHIKSKENLLRRGQEHRVKIGQAEKIFQVVEMEIRRLQKNT